MSEGSAIILAVAMICAFGAVAIAWLIDRRSERIVPDEPYGDATETPRMIHNTRRVNHERTK